MGMDAIPLAYQARLSELNIEASQLRVGQRILVAMVALSAAAMLLLLFLSVAKRSAPLWSSAVPLPLWYMRSADT